MEICRGHGCSKRPTFLLRLRFSGGEIDEIMLCAEHYEVTTGIIAKVCPDVTISITGYQSTESQAVH